MNLATLTTKLGGTLVTNGWDAVCAINAANLNQLFASWYLTNRPTNPVLPVQFVFQSGTSYYLFDAVLGPPEIAFYPNQGNQACKVTMIVVNGILLEFDPASSTVLNAFILLPDFASVVGSLNLTMVKGETALGKVTLDLSAGSYTPSISGVPATSTQGAALSVGLQNYFNVNPTTFGIGGVTTTSVSNWLQPQSFDFVVQPNGEIEGDGCVLLLIQTVQGAGGGLVAPLGTYPIPDTYTASLLVSNNVLFNGLFPSQLTNAKQGITFSSSRAGAGSPYEVQLTTGATDLGVLTYNNSNGSPYSSNGKFEHWYSTAHESADVVISFVGLTIQASSGQLNASYSSSWTQGWAYTGQGGFGPVFPGDSYETAATTLTYNATASVTIKQPSNCIVTFPWSGSPNCSSVLNQNLLWGFGQIDPGSLIQTDVDNQLAPVFDAISTITGLNTFALQNILFYPNQSLNLSTGSIPADLLLVGQTVAELVVTPNSPIKVGIQPGVTPPAVHLAATYQGQPATNLVWGMIPSVPSFGSIDSNTGIYTPPTVAPAGAAVNVTVTNGQKSGNALIILYPEAASNGLIVGPPGVTLTNGQAFDLTVTDENGNNAAVAWTLDPATPSGGTIANVFGAWQYTAPTTITTPTEVTLTATSISNPAQTGTTSINLLPSATLKVTPSADSVATGGQLTLTPTVPVGLMNISWLVYPTGAGTVTGNGTGAATFNASSTASSSVQIVAYGLGNVAAVGYCTIAVTGG